VFSKYWNKTELEAGMAQEYPVGAWRAMPLRPFRQLTFLMDVILFPEWTAFMI